MSAVAARLHAAGVVLPRPLPAFGQYVPAVLDGTWLHLGGHFGTRDDGSVMTGRVGDDIDVEAARAAARSAAVNMLATAQEALGGLDRVTRVVSVLGVVHATPDFTQHTTVVDAASDVLVEAFDEAGRHARLAVGVASLPAGLVLEITAVLRVVEAAEG